ncbi:L-rhamnose/proton symporter RhaT [Reichenbachiella carrageenanivorans]|uniref:L-rhamnose/proton symporter RhaT n=1 Tax=Reichenbachiella carrageenanivorans TaxID=2979869 RepID=A0ABY6D155_9BACT|nr:L-rhamnose/proton symporter RhaT [Reichenbachiella carrageenanivorans]UXX79900.1 L-rhamnose/proton symporter RhaT [Reichenbachiella carrageenanivorans]
MGAILGVIFHAIGGFGAGSFYIPFKQVKQWSWESSWFILGLSAWLIVPFITAWFTIPDLWHVITQADSATQGWTYFFGLLWGIGGLTFGLSMRYLGVSLGMTIALGLCTAFGTLIPPIFKGTFAQLLQTDTGIITLSGILICLIGIAVVGYAGAQKEKETEMAADEEFNLTKGLTVATLSGLLSACFAFGLEAGAPIAQLALASGASDLFQNNAVLVWILWGGMTTNGLYCLYLNRKNRTTTDYTNPDTPLVKNYIWAALGGLTWYLQFFFYGMGTTYLGESLEFASWSIHMAFIIFFSNLWGIIYKEWVGASRNTMWVLALGLAIVMISILMIGLANTITH